MTTSNQQMTKTDPTQVHQVERTRDRAVFAPAVDIVKTAEAVLLRADIPGVDEKNLDITLENGVLTLKAHAEDIVPGNLRLLAGEYVAGDYERVFSLSDEIDQEKIRASVRHGVLTLHLPKAAPAKARKIEVSTG
jgi:HSP20 family protein